MLVFEDLHWADDAQLDFLDYLVDWAADVPLLVVCSARPELLARRPGWGGGKPNAATVSLAPLSADDTARLIAALLNQALLPAETQAALLARAGGNPLYAEEYVRMLADRGFLKKVGGSWRLEHADELPLPESVQGIIAARLDALAPRRKALVQDAAVLGKVGWVGAMAALSGSEPFALEQRLHALERRELLRRERRSQVAGERQYAFRHVLVRDVAYNQLPQAAGRPALAGGPSGSKRCRRTGPRTGPSCSPTTIKRRSSSNEPPARTPPCWRNGPGWPWGGWRPGPGGQRLRGRRPVVCGGLGAVAAPGCRAAAAAAAARAGPDVC